MRVSEARQRIHRALFALSQEENVGRGMQHNNRQVELCTCGVMIYAEEGKGGALGIIDKTLRGPGTLRAIQKNLHVPAVVAHAAEQAVFAVNQGPRVIELDDTAVVEDQDLVVIDDCLQAVGNGNDRAVAQLTQGLLNLGIGCIIDRGSSLVHHQDTGSLEQCTG